MAEKKENSKKKTAASSGGRNEGSAGSKSKKSGSAKSSAGKRTQKKSGTSDSGKQKAGKVPKKNPAGSRIRDEIVAIFMVALGIFLILSVMTSATGEFGEIFSMVLKGLFGRAAYILPFFLIIYALLILMDRMAHVNSRSVFFSVLLYLDITTLNSAFFKPGAYTQAWIAYIKDMFYAGYEMKSAGSVGMALGRLVESALGTAGLVIICAAIMVVCIILIADTPVSVFFDNLREKRNQKLIERQQYYEEHERQRELAVAERAALTAPSSAVSDGAAGASQYESVFGGERGKEKGSDSVSPFANLRIKGANLFKSGGAVRESSDDFKDLPDNQRRIMNYMTDDDIFSDGDGLGAKLKKKIKAFDYPEDDELSNYKAADFFYEIKSIPDRFKDGGASWSFDAGGDDSDVNDAPLEGGLRGGAAESGADHFGEGAAEQSGCGGYGAGLSAGMDDMRQSARGGGAEEEGDAFSGGGAAPDGGMKSAAAGTGGAPADAVKQMTRGEMRAAAAQGAAELSAVINQAEKPAAKEYKLPPISLLNQPERKVNRNEQRELAEKAAKLEQVLHDFGVNAHVIDVKKGPSVTRYEIQPATGVKVNSITKLADDIALNLEAKSLRIEAPIPGKAAVGIEVENDNSSTVTIREMIESPEFESSKSKISFVVGEDIAGNHVVADLKGMPHLLIAGSTGSGKSVCINSLIVSMIYKSTPDEVKFILIDPKVVELGNYNGIPHMLIPVVTDPSKAAAALAWAVQEMNDRYKKFAETSVRKLEEYNKKMEKEGHPEKVLPQIVIIIDELADLMMAAAKQVEESICRLAQLARAAGMHLVVATQRPSVDVVTGLIKANIPSRIAFAVSSQVDSRTILDRAGAEKLVGKGDMLFYPLGKPQPERLQGPFVTDDEVTAVIDFWKEQSDGNDSAVKIMEAINTVMPEVHAEDGDDEDELLSEAIELVINSGQASASMLQRRYRIGYNRAGRLIDIMEAHGIIGPSEGSKPRKVLVSQEEYSACASNAQQAASVQPTNGAFYEQQEQPRVQTAPYESGQITQSETQPHFSDDDDAEHLYSTADMKDVNDDYAVDYDAEDSAADDTDEAIEAGIARGDVYVNEDGEFVPFGGFAGFSDDYGDDYSEQ